MSWYHLTQRRTKDNKPKIYGDVCTKKPTLKKLAHATIQPIGTSGTSVELDVYAGTVFHDSFDNFITACLPGPLCTIFTLAKDVYLSTTSKVQPEFWENIQTHEVVTYDIIGRDCPSSLFISIS